MAWDAALTLKYRLKGEKEMGEQIQVSISNDSVQSIIKAHVQTAVLQALMPHSEKFVREIVEQSLLHKPENHDMNRYKKEHERVTQLEIMVRQIIAKEAETAIKEWAESHRIQIAEQIRKSIAAQGFAKKFAMSMVESMLQSTTYGFKVEVKVGSKDS